MKIYQIVGIEEKIGEFQGNPYHNLYFHCEDKFEKDKGYGARTSIKKIKYDVITENAGKDLTISEIANLLIKKDVIFHYNEYGNVCYFEIQTASTSSEKNTIKISSKSE